jgi:hypothetical protein
VGAAHRHERSFTPCQPDRSVRSAHSAGVLTVAEGAGAPNGGGLLGRMSGHEVTFRDGQPGLGGIVQLGRPGDMRRLLPPAELAVRALVAAGSGEVFPVVFPAMEGPGQRVLIARLLLGIWLRCRRAPGRGP